MLFVLALKIKIVFLVVKDGVFHSLQDVECMPGLSNPASTITQLLHDNNSFTHTHHCLQSSVHLHSQVNYNEMEMGQVSCVNCCRSIKRDPEDIQSLLTTHAECSETGCSCLDPEQSVLTFNRSDTLCCVCLYH